MAAFEWPIRVYWEDTDAGGIVYHANYLKFFERARTEWLRALGIDQHQLKAQNGVLFVVADAALRYVDSARLDDALSVTTELLAAGRASLRLRQRALRAAPQSAGAQLLCQAIIRIGCVNAATLRATRIPEHVLNQLTS